jgi:hypothetical protein
MGAFTRAKYAIDLKTTLVFRIIVEPVHFAEPLVRVDLLKALLRPKEVVRVLFFPKGQGSSAPQLHSPRECTPREWRRACRCASSKSQRSDDYPAERTLAGQASPQHGDQSDVGPGRRRGDAVQPLQTGTGHQRPSLCVATSNSSN